MQMHEGRCRCAFAAGRHDAGHQSLGARRPARATIGVRAVDVSGQFDGFADRLDEIDRRPGGHKRERRKSDFPDRRNRRHGYGQSREPRADDSQRGARRDMPDPNLVLETNHLNLLRSTRNQRHEQCS
jgi:hypothetical protein